MSDLVRFGVAMDRSLLDDFDRRIAERGYENRSEALRDLVRAELTRAAVESEDPVLATLSVVWTTRARQELERSPSKGVVVARLAVPVSADDDACLDVFVLRGRAGVLTDLANRFRSARGTRSVELSFHGDGDA
jgi:CopG family nickel-responsive transcriptional regulator